MCNHHESIQFYLSFPVDHAEHVIALIFKHQV